MPPTTTNTKLLEVRNLSPKVFQLETKHLNSLGEINSEPFSALKIEFPSSRALKLTHGASTIDVQLKRARRFNGASVAWSAVGPENAECRMYYHRVRPTNYAFICAPSISPDP